MVLNGVKAFHRTGTFYNTYAAMYFVKMVFELPIRRCPYIPVLQLRCCGNGVRAACMNMTPHTICAAGMERVLESPSGVALKFQGLVAMRYMH